MNSEMIKKAWQQPRLIVLARGRQEETVLEGCKGISATTPAIANTGCSFGTPGDCTTCEAWGVS